MHLHILFTSHLFPTAKPAAFWANMHMDDLGIHSTLILQLAFSCFPILFLSHEFYLPGHLFPPTCFSDFQDHSCVLSLPFWHLPSSSSLISTEGSGPQSPLIAPAHSETHVFDSSSPHFSLQQVLHRSFILALTRDLLCKATSRSCRLIQVLPRSLASVTVSPQSQITPSSHPLSMIVPWFSFLYSPSSPSAVRVHPHRKCVQHLIWTRNFLALGIQTATTSFWPWSTHSLQQWVSNLMAHLNHHLRS